MSDGAVTVKRYSEENYNELNFESIKIALASPEAIREWSCGEVTKPETINYRTLKPEMGGLFCEKIFGPVKDWECHCGKYKRVRFKGKTCEKCGVKITKAKVRRERMGHIELACPVSHIWYFKGIPSRIGLMLDVSPRDLDKVLYFAKYIVVDPGDTPLEKFQVISDKEYDDMAEKYDADSFDARMGAEAIKDLLAEIDVEELASQLRSELISELVASLVYACCASYASDEEYCAESCTDDREYESCLSHACLLGLLLLTKDGKNNTCDTASNTDDSELAPETECQ